MEIRIAADQIYPATHGKEGAVNGIMKMNDGKQYAFADFYEFKNTTSIIIKSMTSYVIEI
jgi:hypothetical protein